MSLPYVKLERFTARILISTEEAVHLVLTGEADMEAAEALGVFLVRSGVIAGQAGTPSVVLDLRRVDILTSPCLKRIVSWLLGIERLEKPYQVVIRADSSKPWQAHTLAALRCFAAELVRIEV